MGSKKGRRKLKKDVESNPIMLFDKPMKEEKVMKYLGDYLESNLEDSVHTTVVKRVAVAKHAVYEIRTVIEDTRAGKKGALGLAFDIYEQSLLQMLL